MAMERAKQVSEQIGKQEDSRILLQDKSLSLEKDLALLRGKLSTQSSEIA